MSDKKQSSELLFIGLIYLMFFLSGAAALIYQVVWVRSLSLIFGGTHLAVTTVLSVFMGGLALGSYIIGKRVDALKKPLRFYGFLELAIALFAIVFIILMKVYPSVYIFLVPGGESSRIYQTFIRVLFSFLILIVPTTLMGGTLPVLTRFVSGQSQKLGSKLSLLYGFNTLGAVFGTAMAAFFLLRFFSVSTALNTAIILNTVIGVASIGFQKRASAELSAPDSQTGAQKPSPAGIESDVTENINPVSLMLVLVGIGVSGFCALGYEVLWTRILTLTIGTSVYGFSIMLIAFLTGIALGSKSYGLVSRVFRLKENNLISFAFGFGIVQVIIGVTALIATFFIRDLPVNSIQLRDFFLQMGLGQFHARQGANFALAFSYMLVPAFFMGLAFPVAGIVNAYHRKKVGHAVGDVLAFNTVGAILGSAVSGYVLIYVFDIERSLQLLTVINIGFGLLVMFSIRNVRMLNLGIACLTVASLLFLALNPDMLRMWDMRYFAIFQNNQPEAYNTPQRKREAIRNTDVLYFEEGINSTISVIKVKGGNQGLLVNGKVVASASLKDQQCQYTLGHLPMLLHDNPRKVLVIGLGTGMTLGATSVHPGLEELTLAEIEPNVVGAARTFEKYNNHVLDNPKLKIIHNDGRNFLMTTRDRYDVITADPIHPWTQGSGYLYTAEYFKIASEHLLPGGIMCQWLPIYELSVDDLKSVLKTFSQNFKYAMVWLTQYDAEIIGSNSPIIIDEAELEKRIAFPAIAENLRPVMMDSSTDFLSYFIMGTKGAEAFGSDGIVNTDDNLYLEFSTPLSLGENVMGVNVAGLARYRESILPYLAPPKDPSAREEQQKKWTAYREAASLADYVHALLLNGSQDTQEFRLRLAQLEQAYPSFSPVRFIRAEYEDQLLQIPKLLDMMPLEFLNERGERVVIEISAVIVRVSHERAKVAFVDNTARKIFGQLYFSGDGLDERMGRFTQDVFAGIQATYRSWAESAQQEGREYPYLTPAMTAVQDIIQEMCKTTENP